MEKVEKMSFFSKIFQNKKSCRKHQCKWTLPDHSRGLVLPGFNRNNVRLVIIVQHPNTNQGGKVLYDSKIEQRIASNTHDVSKRNMCRPQCVFTNNGKPPCTPSRGQQQQNSTPFSGRERRCRLASDVKVLEEMMFGSAPIIPKGSSLKVHTTKNPPQLMVTKLFLSTENIKEHSGQESFDLYSIHSTSMESVPKQIYGSDKSSISLESLARSVPVDVPMHHSHGSEDNEDSGFSASMASSCGSSFTTSGYSPSSSASINSLNSRTRRLLRNQNTSLDYSVNKRWSDDNIEPSLPSKRPSKLGVGITFNMSEGETENFRKFESFFFSHITLIESHVVKLKLAVEKALEKHNKYMVTEALDVFRNAVYDLYSAPRLTRPVWLSMMQYSTHQVALSQDFLKDFISVIDKYNSKNTKFFMSTLLTAVLTHHLAWVPTVTPAGATPARTYLDKHSAKWLDALAKSHPYNPLWAQLGDLYGAIGFPLRQSRTVVVGQKADLVCKLLHILSYFIRCSEVQESAMHRPDLDYMDGHMDIPGTGMHTIEEDDNSGSEEAVSCEKNYGSATSGGTVRHVSMQTSTETVLSTKSDGTVIERIPEMRKGRSFCSSLSCDEACGELSHVSGSCSSGGGVPLIYGKDIIQCCEQCDIVQDDILPTFCDKCQEYWTARDSIHKRTTGWQHGNSVFYCCQDILDNSEHSICQCNFDLCAQRQQEENCSQCDNSEVAENETAFDPTAEIPVETETEEATESSEDIIRTCSFKPLKLFRMLSHDPTEGVAGEATVCESSFCDKLPSDDCTAQSDGSDNTDTSVPVNTLHSVSLLRPEPEDLFLLHASSHTECVSERTPTSTEPRCGQALSPSREEESICRLSPNTDGELKVRRLRMRNVGRASETAPRFAFENIVHGDVPHSPLMPEIMSKKDHSKTPSGFMSSEVHSEPFSELPVTSEVLAIKPELSSSESIETANLPTAQTLPSSEISVEKSPSLAPASSSSLSPDTRRCPLYPCLQTLENPSSSRESPAVHSETQAQTLTSRQLSPRTLESMLLENPSLLEEPGSVRLIKRDPGTLYPKISGNTVISSLSSDISSRCVSTASATVDVSIKNFGMGLDVIKDSTGDDDDVFFKNDKRVDTDITSKREEVKNASVSAEDFANVSVSKETNEAALHCRPMEGDIVDGDIVDKVQESPMQIMVSVAEDACCHGNTHVTLTEGSSPAHSKVTAWLAARKEQPSNKTQSLPTHASQSKTTSEAVSEETLPNIVEEEPTKERIKDISTPLGKDAPRSLSQAKVQFLNRSNSMFDEYFTDDSVQLPNLSKMEQKAISSNAACGLCQNTLSHVDNPTACLPTAELSCICQQYISKELSISSSAKSKRELSLEGPLSMLDEYFTENAEAVTLPEGPSKDMVTSTIFLMKEAQLTERFASDMDELNIEDLIEASVEARSRSNSESSTSRSRNGGGLDRQHSSGSGVSRQNSLGTGGAPARCRSVTPTELSKRRHPSSVSNISWDLDSPEARNNMTEIPLPRTLAAEGHEGSSTFDHNFGHSLIAGYTDHYMSDFILHGTSDKNLLSKLHADLSITLQNSVLDEKISEACCIEADTDKMVVRLHSCRNGSGNRIKPPMEMKPSQMVSNIIESIHKLFKLKMSPEFCLMHLEDRLQEIYFKSKMLSEYILAHRKIDHKELTTMLGLDNSDLPLLLAVAGTHTSTLALALANQS